VRFGELVGEQPNEVTWARGRLTGRTYLHATFTLDLRASQDYGQPARFVVKVFDESGVVLTKGADPDLEWTEEVVMTTPGGRKQVKIQVARESGHVREIQLQKVPISGDATKLETLLTLGRDDSARLIDLIRALDYIPVEGGESTVRLDDQTIRDVFADPSAIHTLYGNDPERFRELIEADPSADDIIAVAHRQEVVSTFRTLLDDPAYFDAMRTEWAKDGSKLSREGVWQVFLETNPWILGVALGGQLLTSWDNDKLEQVVAGFSIGGPGKRADALLRTSGKVRSLVFAEFKHHETDLLQGSSYRSGCWPASTELVGGVTQVQQTVMLACRQLGDRLFDKAPDGSNTGEATYLLRPRSYLILGHLNQLRGTGGGVHDDKFQSFELYRRNLYEPEVITFDELLARAEWHVQVASSAATS